MKVLITGATGFIGSHLAEALHAKGYTLRCLVRKTSNLRWIRHLPIEYIYGDLFDHEILKQAVNDIDYVYHVAGLTKARSRAEYFQGNHIATRNLLDAVLTRKDGIKRLVHISTQAAVGPSTDRIPIDEKTPYHPITAYGESKMEAEMECQKVMDRLSVTIIRPPAVYGPRDTDVFEFFNTVNKGLQPIIGFREKWVSLVNVRDLVDGIILAGEHPRAIGQTYFISSEKYYNWKEIGEITKQVMGKKTVTIHIPEFAVYAIAGICELYTIVTHRPALLNLEKVRDIVQDAWTCSIEKSKMDLAYDEKIELAQGIRDVVGWYRREGWLP